MDKNAISVKGKGQYQLVLATQADIALLHTWFANEHELLIWGGPSMQHCSSASKFNSVLSERHFDSYCLYNEQEFIGFGQIQRHSEKRVHLGRLAIKPELRGEGLSHYLLENLIAIAKTNYYAQFVSLFVYVSNSKAKHVYLKNGFVIASPPKGMPKMEACEYMLKRL